MKLMAQGTMGDLTAALGAAGQDTEVYESGDGTKLLLLPRGARILGFYAPGDETNFYWVNQALESEAAARDLFASTGWQNTGGDRTWVTPELDIFFPDYPACRAHWEPPQLDASDYAVTRLAHGMRLARRMSLKLARPGREVELELAKTLSPAANPLRHEKAQAGLLAAVQYAGYTQRTTLALLGEAATCPVALGLWNLIQLPHQGELLVPTYTRAQPLVLFGEAPAEKLRVSDRLVRWSVTYPGEHKIAVRAAATCGRVGYLYPQGDQWALVVRNFSVNPSSDYVDVPKNDPADLGYAVHAVNIDSALGDFCEMEYHAPAIRSELGEHASEDVSQVWAFRGGRQEIGALATLLLGSLA